MLYNSYLMYNAIVKMQIITFNIMSYSVFVIKFYFFVITNHYRRITIEFHIGIISLHP